MLNLPAVALPRGEVEGSGWGVFRPIPMGEVEGSDWGVSRPIPGEVGSPGSGGPCPGRGWVVYPSMH